MRDKYARGAAFASALLVGGAAVLFAALQSSGSDPGEEGGGSSAVALPAAQSEPLEVGPPQQVVEVLPDQSSAEVPLPPVADPPGSPASPAPEPAQEPVPAPVPAAATPPDSQLVLGRLVYDDERCAACHSIAGVGGRRGALDGVGRRLDRETIRLWIVDPQAVRPGIRKPSYEHLSAERLDALIAYMESLAER